jgi:hypothetical protein
MNVSTWGELERIIQQELNDAMKIVGNDIKTIIGNYVKRKVYDAYSPKMYDRTGDLLNCLDVSEVKKIGNYYEVSIFFNTDFIHSNEVEDGWNQHMNADGSETWNGIPVNKLIPVFIEHGVNGSLWDRDGIESIEYVRNKLASTDRHLKVIARVLRMRGFNVKIG